MVNKILMIFIIFSPPPRSLFLPGLSEKQVIDLGMALSPVFLYGLSKKLTFVPIASAMTAVHRDCLVLAFCAPWPEIQPLES